MLTRLRATVTALVRRDRFEQEMAEEMRFHVAAYTRDLVRGGMSPEDAERRARSEFGGVESLREDCRDAQGLRFFDELRQDIRYAVRQMVRAPGFAAAVVLSLALAIGANTAIFSLMDALLFRTLPVADPTDLYFLEHRANTDTTSSSNYPLFERYSAVGAFRGVAAFDRQTLVVGATDGQERVDGQYVSGNYHAVLGIPMRIGRGFSSESDRPSEQSDIAVISDAYWQRRFARSPAAIGQAIVINGRSTTIIGVTAAGFDGFQSGRRLDVTLPLSVRALGDPRFLNARDGWTSLTLIARLSPGITPAQATTAANSVFHPFWTEPENAWAREGMGLQRHAVLVPAGHGSRDLQRLYGTPLRILMAMVTIVLAIACANVANLLLARSAARTREVAVRLSIGAGRARLIRQFLTESLLYAFAGGAGGIVIAVVSTGMLLSLFATGEYPMYLDVESNRHVLGFTVAVSILTGTVFGLAPAFTTTRVDLTRSLKEGGFGRAPHRRLATGKLLVIGQLSLCVLVLTATGLLVRTLANLRTFDAGFQRDHILLFNVETWRGFTPERRAAFYGDLQQRLRGLDGVTAVSISDRSPMDNTAQSRGIIVPGVPPDRIGVSAFIVTPDYFRVFAVPVIRGRAFDDQDGRSVARVALVNEAMARRYFGNGDPIGRTFHFLGESESATIMGVIPNSHHESLRDDAPATVYVLMAQPASRLDDRPALPAWGTVAIRTRGDAHALAASVRDEVRALSTDAVVSYIRTMEQQVDAALTRERLLASLSAGFGILALLLAFLGLYGVMSYRVARRSREIGVRMALGATQSLILRQVFGETLWIAAVGIAIGLAGALVTTRVVAAFLFGLSPRDPALFVIVTATLFGIALVAGFVPARRSAGVDPVRALRAE
jgi:predicted permease